MERKGEYLLERLMGEGGMGKVYEAKERLSGRRVAVKVLRPELARTDAGRRLFLNEMAILAKLDHPHIVRCLACTEVDDELLMALEYLDGRTLRDYLLERGALSWTEAVRIVVAVARALSTAHGSDPPVIHRDLKPENIMLIGRAGVKVMDFGIAKVLEALHKTTTQSAGTLQYMSPEQIDATGVDARSDLYCLGLVFYELLAGHPPFQSASPRELLNLQCTAAPPPLPEAVRSQLPRGIEQLLFELLEKDPDDRPASAIDVLHELEPFAPASEVGSSDHDAPADGSDESAATYESVTRGSNSWSRDGHGTGGDADGAVRSPSKDTIALVEEVSAPREVPTWLAWAVIVALGLIAGTVTYLVRSPAREAAERSPGDRAVVSVQAEDRAP